MSAALDDVIEDLKERYLELGRRLYMRELEILDLKKENASLRERLELNVDTIKSMVRAHNTHCEYCKTPLIDGLCARCDGEPIYNDE